MAESNQLQCKPINPFISNAPFLYPLKASENRKFFWCFEGLGKGCIRNKWANFFILTKTLRILAKRNPAGKYMLKVGKNMFECV